MEILRSWERAVSPASYEDLSVTQYIVTGLRDYSIMLSKLAELYLGLYGAGDKPNFLWQRRRTSLGPCYHMLFFHYSTGSTELDDALLLWVLILTCTSVDIMKSLKTLLFCSDRFWSSIWSAALGPGGFRYLKYSKFSNLHPSQIALNYWYIPIAKSLPN